MLIYTVRLQPTGGSHYVLAFMPLTPFVSTQLLINPRLILVGNKCWRIDAHFSYEDTIMSQEQSINKAIRQVYFIGSERLWVSVKTRGLPKQMDTGRLQVYSFSYNDGELTLRTEEGVMTTCMVEMAPKMPCSDLCLFAGYILMNGVRFERVMIDFYPSKTR